MYMTREARIVTGILYIMNISERSDLKLRKRQRTNEALELVLCQKFTTPIDILLSCVYPLYPSTDASN